MTALSVDRALAHYSWGAGCEGWVLVDSPYLSVKLETMPAGTSEALHMHHHAQQFFFVLEGVAVFEVEGHQVIVHQQEGLHILPGKKHRITNNSTEALKFLLSSQPSTNHDRVNL